mmetsp:Transcript_6714/g.8776  ORF Transcript_6714/g.8776 Transcript_6714/m.8776 type:complete len:582 (-) Transcript_6714:1574-3319(-)
MTCHHELECEFADVQGMNCDGECLRSSLLVGEPLLSCRECNEDVCSNCWTERTVNYKRLKWTPFHFEAVLKKTPNEFMQKAGMKRDIFGWTPLHWAAFKGNHKFLRCFSTNNELFLMQDHNSQNVLMLACHSRSLEIVKMVFDTYIGAGCSRSSIRKMRDRFGRSLIRHACESTPEILEYILCCLYLQNENQELKTVLNQKDENGDTVLLHSIVRGNLQIVQVLLNNGANVNELNNDGTSPLILALKQPECEDRESFIQLLLENGADQAIGISADDNGMSPLMLSAAEGNLNISRMLIKYGGDKSLKDVDGAGVMYYAVKNLSVCDQGEEDSEFVDTKDYASVSAFFIETGIEVDNADRNGITPLILACEENNLECAKQLLATGKVNVDLETTEGNTALHHAVKSANVELVRLLLCNKANVDKANNNGLRPLHWAVQNPSQSREVIELLLQYGADPNSVSLNELLTPLHIAAVLCNEDVVRVLIEAGANVNAADRDGDTPLHNAAGKTENGQDRIPIIKNLLSAGAWFKESVNLKGFTPLAAAAAAENREIAAILVKRGAKMISDSSIKDPNEVKKKKLKQ